MPEGFLRLRINYKCSETVVAGSIKLHHLRPGCTLIHNYLLSYTHTHTHTYTDTHTTCTHTRTHTQLARIQSPSEHLQLYYQANRRFRTIFDNQEQLSTYHTYDRTPEGDGGSKNMRSKLTFRKPANWLPYIRVK